MLIGQWTILVESEWSIMIDDGYGCGPYRDLFKYIILGALVNYSPPETFHATAW